MRSSAYSTLLTVVTLILVVAPASPALATSPGLGGDLAYDVDEQIWTRPPGFGGQATKLTTAGGRGPAWSPDGMKIAFSASRNATSGDIWVMNADGSQQVRLTSSPVDESDPSWSPDGTQLAYSEGDMAFGISIVQANGARPHSVFLDGSAAAEDPSWSPDGSLIAFTLRTVNTNESDIWVVNPDGTFPRPVVADGRDPSWDPDGSRILFTRDQGAASQVRVVSRAGGTSSPVADLSEFARGWFAPDGVIYTKYLVGGTWQVQQISGAGPPDLFSTAGALGSVDWQPVAPAPDISGVEGALVAGMPGASITITGAGFARRSIVRWNGADRPTTFVNGSRLTVQLNAADLAVPGSALLSVFTPPAGGGVSTPLAVTIAPARRITVSAARFAVRWRLSQARGRLELRGILERAATVDVALVRGGRVMRLGRRTVGGGPFSASFGVPPRLYPGRFDVRVQEVSAPPGSPPLTEGVRRVELRRPPEGVVRISSISTIGPRGPTVVRTASARRLFARFILASRPTRRAAIVTEWTRNGVPVRGTRISRAAASRIDAVVRSPTRLPSGRWRCLLSVGGKVIGATAVRLG